MLARWKPRIAFIAFIAALTFVGGAPNKLVVLECSGQRSTEKVEDALGTPTAFPTPVTAGE